MKTLNYFILSLIGLSSCVSKMPDTPDPILVVDQINLGSPLVNAAPHPKKLFYVNSNLVVVLSGSTITKIELDNNNVMYLLYDEANESILSVNDSSIFIIKKSWILFQQTEFPILQLVRKNLISLKEEKIVDSIVFHSPSITTKSAVIIVMEIS